MVIRISTEQLNVNDIMNNEPPLILISKQLLIVYKASGWSREEMTEGREGRKLKKARDASRWSKKKKWGMRGERKSTLEAILLLNGVFLIFLDTSIQVQSQTALPQYTYWHFLWTQEQVVELCSSSGSTKPLSFPENAQKSETAPITKVVFSKTGF